MRKHFLLLFLMALLPLAGWALTEPTKVGDFNYDGQEHALFATTGSADGTLKYAVTTVNDVADAVWVTWSAPGPKAKDAGTYYLWFKVEGGQEAQDAQLVGAVTINSIFPIDLDEGWSVVVDPVSKQYTGSTVSPDVIKIKKGNDEVVYDPNAPQFKVEWADAQRINVTNAGYTVRVSANMTTSVGESVLTKKFWILKNQAYKKTEGVLPNDVDNQTPGVQVGWTGYAIDLVKTAPVVTLGDANGADVTTCGGKIDYYVNGVKWTEDGVPTAINTGAYTISYKVEDTDNFDGIGTQNAIEIGTVNIVGTDIDPNDITEPEGPAANLTFAWDNEKAAPVEQYLLATNGEVDEAQGTIMYSFTGNDNDWTEQPLKASAADTYHVYWKVAPAAGKNEYIPNPAYIAVTIDPVTPVIDAATANTLTYNTTGNQQLLAAPATASFGASTEIKYVFRYNADPAHDWSNDNTAFGQDVYTNYAEIVGTNAGSYQIKSYIEDGGNYENVEPTYTPVVINRALVFTAAPTANDLTWNGDVNGQQLITAGEGTVENKVEYSVDQILDGNNVVFAAINWTTNIANIKAVKGLTYTVHYRTVNDNNYAAVNNTNDATIEVTIKKKALSVKVNNVTKTYDGTTTLTDVLFADAAEYNAAKGTQLDDNAFNALTPAQKFKAPANYEIDGGLAKFSFITPINGKDDFSLLNYKNNIPAQYKDADTHAGVVTVDADDLEAINAANDYYYQYTIIPGDLTVEKAKLTITAQTGLNTDFGTAYDISGKYDVVGLVTVNQVSETLADAFGLNVPVLTSSEAVAANYNVGSYKVEFTPGTLLADANYEMSDAGENNDGYVIGQANFVINPVANHHIVITVLPKSKVYGEAYDWSNMEENKDYYVTGLIDGDVISDLTFSSTAPAEKADVNIYELKVNDGVTVTNPNRYPGGIICNNSTFEVTPKELVAHVNQQYVYANAPESELNQDAWTVDGLEYEQTKADLLINDNDVALAYNTTVGDYAVLGTPGTYTNGIKLTITNPNYTLKADSEYGILTVTDANDFVLDQDDVELPSKLAAANPAADYQITFATRELKAGYWYTMVLPFDIRTADLVASLKAVDDPQAQNPTYHTVYAIVNRFSTASTTDHIQFKLEMNSIPANEPFMIKTAETIDLKNADFGQKKIVYSATPVITDAAGSNAGNEFRGVYATTSIQAAAATNYYPAWYDSENTKADPKGPQWRVPGGAAKDVAPMEAYLVYSPEKSWNNNAPLITFEDLNENGTTSIVTFNADSKSFVNVDGWYTLNGVKLQGAPTEKGIYINNGKKIVIK